MLKIDSRLIHKEDVDHNSAILIDAHSAAGFVKELEQEETLINNTAQNNDKPLIMLSNFIQYVVLYETIVIDSLFFEVSESVNQIAKLFPEIIKGVYIKPSERKELSNALNSILLRITTPDILTHFPDEEISGIDFFLRRQGAAEKPIWDEVRKAPYNLVPDENEFLERMLMGSDFVESLRIPPICRDSGMNYARAHFYLEFARHLNIPYCPDPIRSRYFQKLVQSVQQSLQSGKPEKSIALHHVSNSKRRLLQDLNTQVKRMFKLRTPENVVRNFQKAVTAPPKEALVDYSGLISAELHIPPVAELVLRRAKKRNIPLVDATLELRESRNACEFRKWCHQFSSLRNEGLAGEAEQTRLMGQLETVCKIWREDVGEEVNYRSRKLNLEVIPIMGSVLKALNLHEVLDVQMPVLEVTPKFSYFLFLNDLLRN